jgi:hypothetical protein
MLDASDDLHILQQTQTGLRILKPRFSSQRLLVYNAMDFFFSPHSRRDRRIPIYLTNRGPLQTAVSLFNTTSHCIGLSEVTQIFALSKDLSCK